jgi:hypothetical protein
MIFMKHLEANPVSALITAEIIAKRKAPWLLKWLM